MSEQEEPKTHTDAFGQKRDSASNAPVIDAPKQPEFVEMNGTKYVNDGTGKPKTDEKGNPLAYKSAEEQKSDDIESNPVVKELRTQLKKSETDRASMGKSLSEQREKFEKRLDKIEKGEKTPKSEPIFKEVKRVKDLSKAEQEGMTDTEKRLFDQNADLMDTMNKMHADGQAETEKQREEREAAEEKEREEQEANEADEEFNSDVQSRVMKLAANNVEMANKILAEFNNFKDNHLQDEDEIDSRLQKAAKLVPDYKPPQEQKAPTGSAVRNAGNSDDPFGNEAVVDQVFNSKRNNNYSL